MAKSIYSIDPVARLRRASIAWFRQGLCRSCGRPALVGYIDGKAIERACDSCGAHSRIHVVKKADKIRQLLFKAAQAASCRKR